MIRSHGSGERPEPGPLNGGNVVGEVDTGEDIGHDWALY